LFKPANLLTFIGILVLLTTFSNSVLVTRGSAGHWGFLVAVQDGQEEVVVAEATAEPQSAVDGTAGDEILVPMDGQAGMPAQAAQDLTPTPRPLAELKPDVVYQPEEIDIPAISLHAPVVQAKYRVIQLQGKRFQQWLPPAKFAAGWHTSSAALGQAGNTVLNGHNNLYGGVFDRLRDLKPGDRIEMTSQGIVFVYEVSNVLNLPEKYESLETRMANARWLQASEDERLTLVTCWPPDHNTNRWIVVAKPVDRYVAPVEGAAVAAP
jgi:LPXTG-site transpeptidase (sortase) family protein